MPGRWGKNPHPHIAIPQYSTSSPLKHFRHNPHNPLKDKRQGKIRKKHAILGMLFSISLHDMKTLKTLGLYHIYTLLLIPYEAL